MLHDFDTRLEAVPFTFPPLAGRSVFVLGLGGGCDVITGCDGETSVEDLGRSTAQHAAAGRYRGCFALAPLLPVLRALSEGLSEMRTPRIMLAAADEQLQRDGDRVIVPRGCKPAVPAVWLATAYVFAPEPA